MSVKHLKLLALACMLGFVACGGRSASEAKVWHGITSVGDQSMVATFGGSGVARVGPDGGLRWEVVTDHVRRPANPHLAVFADGIIAVTGVLADGSSVLDGVDPKSGARLWRIAVPHTTALAAVAVQGARRYALLDDAGTQGHLVAFDDARRNGWTRPLEGAGGWWTGATLWADAARVVLLGNHRTATLDAATGEVVSMWETLGRVVRVDDRLIWLAYADRDGMWPTGVERAHVAAGAGRDAPGTMLAAWRPGTQQVEVLGNLPASHNLVGVGRFGMLWVATTSSPGPNLSIIGLPRADGGDVGWRLDVAAGDMPVPSMTLGGWFQLETPTDGALMRYMPVTSFDGERRVRTRWLDLELGAVGHVTEWPNESNVVMRRDGQGFVAVTGQTAVFFEADGKRTAEARLGPGLAGGFLTGQTVIEGRRVWRATHDGGLMVIDATAESAK